MCTVLCAPKNHLLCLHVLRTSSIIVLNRLTDVAGKTENQEYVHLCTYKYHSCRMCVCVRTLAHKGDLCLPVLQGLLLSDVYGKYSHFAYCV